MSLKQRHRVQRSVQVILVPENGQNGPFPNDPTSIEWLAEWGWLQSPVPVRARFFVGLLA